MNTSSMDFPFYFQPNSNFLNTLFSVTAGARVRGTLIQRDVTEVTFTVGPTGHRMITWFGSSGGGLPEAS